MVFPFHATLPFQLFAPGSGPRNGKTRQKKFKNNPGRFGRSETGRLVGAGCTEFQPAFWVQITQRLPVLWIRKISKAGSESGSGMNYYGSEVTGAVQLSV